MLTNRIFTRFQYARLPFHMGNPHLALMEDLEQALRRAPSAVASVRYLLPDDVTLCQTVQGIEAAFYLLNRPYQLNIFCRTGPASQLQIRCWVAENPLTRALLTCSLIEPALDAIPSIHAPPLAPPPPAPSGFWQQLPEIDQLEQIPDGRVPAFSLLLR